jgi:hypothetical protein
VLVHDLAGTQVDDVEISPLVSHALADSSAAAGAPVEEAPHQHYTRAELTARTPWKQFFTHPVAIALLVSCFAYVSYFAIVLFVLHGLISISGMYVSIRISSRVGWASRCCLRCPRT